VDGGELWQGANTVRAGFFAPAEPAADEGLVDAGDGGQTTAGVAVHRGVADGGFGAVARGEEQRAAEVGKHPDAGSAGAGLDILECQVVGFPIKLSADAFGNE